MIISASRRTDIPAFFGEWMMKRISEGFFYRVNPFNAKQVSKVSLLPQDVQVIVFWSKNPKPFLKHIDALDRHGYRYYFQFTLNDYPTQFEPGVPPLGSRIDTFLRISERLGPDRVVWRYDPIMVSSISPMDDQLERISAIASQLKGAAKRLTVSFMDFYGKVERRLELLEKQHGITFTDITAPEHRDMLDLASRQLAEIARRNGMEIETCAEAVDLESCGITHGRCIDPAFIRRAWGIELPYKKDPNQRPECLCTQAVDVGMYNTCSFNCTYCYAIQSEKAVRAALKRHDPASPSLLYNYDPIP
ncbi:DUF1848 domain-containing protein [Paenibacillus turpanensis]|uniref:DUF1848 domain-containing protein n=1 Tax=Paenibacillus turpanensis TaxID=2689078 RepID=UPI00140B2068|nr:DUF1848 domain-containing protein [Paenibacillus turpanensis]